MVKWSSADLANSSKQKEPKPRQKLDQQLATTDVQDALSAISITRKAENVEYDVDGKYILFALRDGSKWKVTVTKV